MVIILILIIAGTLVYNAVTGVNLRKLNRMYNDVEMLSDKVSNYYAKYGTIPIKYDSEGRVIDVSGIAISVLSSRDANDNNNYYVLELSNLSGISLYYGEDYESVNSSSDVVGNNDLYIINEQSHKIYYLKGVKFEGTIYFTKD